MSTPKPPPPLTTTSYAVLGLLAIRPWTTYELAQQMRRSMRRFWPRAESRIYEEPKRLVALDLASASHELVGRRPRTVYSITSAGRAALAAWLAEPGGGMVVEFEALLKVFYGDQASTTDVRTNIAAIAEWAAEQNRENVGFARLYLDSGGPFPDRLPVIVLTGAFMTYLTDAVAQWAAWAEGAVADWPADPTSATPDLATLASIAERTVDDEGGGAPGQPPST